MLTTGKATVAEIFKLTLAYNTTTETNVFQRDIKVFFRIPTQRVQDELNLLYKRRVLIKLRGSRLLQGQCNFALLQTLETTDRITNITEKIWTTPLPP